MDDLTLQHPDGVFLRRDARAHGVDDRELQRLVREQALVRVRRGAYVAGDTWRAADAVERFRLRGAAVLRTHPEVVLSHTSAAAEWGLRLWGADLSVVHVTRLDGLHGAPARGIAYHHGRLRPEDVVLDGHRRLVTPVRAAIETATVNEVESGVCCLDTLLDSRLSLPGVRPVPVEALHEMRNRVAHWPGAQRLQVSLRLARAGAQSVGESRSRVMCWRHRLPEPELQWRVLDGTELVAVCDFGWPVHQALGEFDGRGKYLRPFTPGQDPGDVVFEEKRREDAVRAATSWSFVRWTWADLEPARQGLTAARIRRALSLD